MKTRTAFVHGMRGEGPTVAKAKADAVARIMRIAVAPTTCSPLVACADGTIFAFYCTPDGPRYAIHGPGRGYPSGCHFAGNYSWDSALLDMVTHAMDAYGILWTSDVPATTLAHAADIVARRNADRAQVAS